MGQKTFKCGHTIFYCKGDDPPEVCLECKTVKKKIGNIDKITKKSDKAEKVFSDSEMEVTKEVDRPKRW